MMLKTAIEFWRLQNLRTKTTHALALAFTLTSLAFSGCTTSGSSITAKDKIANADGKYTITEIEGLPPVENKATLLGPGDQIDIFVWGYEDLSKRVTVNYNGMLPYAYTGELNVQGKTTSQVQQEIRTALLDFIKEPVVRVTVSSVRPIRFHVLGSVKKPGVFSLSVSDSRVLEAIAQAGGLSDDAQDRLLLVREDAGKVYIHSIDYKALTRQGNLKDNVVLTENDIIFVPISTTADIAREARRISDILTPLLIFQNITLLWDSFTRALMHGNHTSTSSNTTFVINTK